MQAEFSLRSLALNEVKALLIAQQLPLPADIEVTGHGDLEAKLVQKGESSTANFTLALRDAGFQNADFTAIGEKLALTVQGNADLASSPILFNLQLEGGKGQALAGPVLLDFDRNPLQLTLAGTYAPNAVQITALRSLQRNLATVTGNVELAFAPFAVKEASLQATDIRFPAAAYTTYLQLLLATTPFNQLTATGGAELQLQLRDNQPTQLDLTVRNLDFSDAARSLKVAGVNANCTGQPARPAHPDPRG